MFAQHRQRAKEILKKTELIHDTQAVQAAVSRVAAELNRRFDQPDETAFPLVLGVMGGAVIFTGQLLPQLTFPLEYDYIHVSRYGDDDKGGQLQWKVIPRQNVRDRTVIVLDDILDEGETLAEVKQRLLSMGARDVVLAVFADKQIDKKKAVEADVVGLTVPNKFVIGFGMDTHGYWRNLPEIRAVKSVG
ncbi:MAG: hypoxanthine-guanine phosphoribosyltransferase [Oxalobacter sp.]|nr:MAG: hypoxanthine-guanine phosphoribosyltransferase [Oxalobacter sp.]